MTHSFAEKLLLLFCKEPGESTSKTNLDEWGDHNALSILCEVFPDFRDLIKNKLVVDFGSGLGYQTAALAKEGASGVLGLETNEKLLSQAKELVEESETAKKIKFKKEVEPEDREKFDIVISQNSMEHFPDPQGIVTIMKSLLKPDGMILVTFGPPWFAPTGSHMNYFVKIPWVNILFSEKTVMNVRKKFRSDGAGKYEDVESGLNKMSVGKFEDIISRCGLKIKYKQYDCVKKLNFLGRIPFLRELFINRINCILTK